MSTYYRWFAVMLILCALISISPVLSADSEWAKVVIDGVATEDKALVVYGIPYIPLSMLDKIEGRKATYDSENRQIIIRKAEEVAYIKPVLEVVMGEPQCKDIIESLGLSYRKSVAVPEKLQFYSCVIINNDNAATPAVAGRLKRYIADGGQVIMVGGSPIGCCGGEDISSISDWFGCTKARKLSGMLGFYLGTPSFSIVTYNSKPLGTSWPKDTTIYARKGSGDYYAMGDTDEFCEVFAVWVLDDDKESTPAAAFKHTYGKGSLYWQSLIDDPNYPKLKELFSAALRRIVSNIGDQGKGQMQ